MTDYKLLLPSYYFKITKITINELFANNLKFGNFNEFTMEQSSIWSKIKPTIHYDKPHSEFINIIDKYMIMSSECKLQFINNIDITNGCKYWRHLNNKPESYTFMDQIKENPETRM